MKTFPDPKYPKECRDCKTATKLPADPSQTKLPAGSPKTVLAVDTTLEKPAARNLQELPVKMVEVKCRICSVVFKADENFYVGSKSLGGWDGNMVTRCQDCRKNQVIHFD